MSVHCLARLPQPEAGYIINEGYNRIWHGLNNIELATYKMYVAPYNALPLIIKSLPRRDRIPIYQMAYTKSLVVYSQSGLLSQIFSGIIDQCVGLFIMKLLTFCGIHACEIMLSCQPIEDIFTCIRHFPSRNPANQFHWSRDRYVGFCRKPR